MKKHTVFSLVAAALLALVGSGCASRNTGAVAAINDTPNRRVTTVTDRQGNTTETVLDNSGRAAAAEGQAVLSTEEMWKKLVSRVPDKESPEYGWTMTDTSYSVLDIPNEELIQKKEEEHKAALQEVARLAKAGATKQYEDALASAAALGKDLADLVKARASGNSGGQRGDRASIVSRTLSVGPNHTLVPLAQAQAMQAAVASRHGNQNMLRTTTDLKSTDTTTVEELSVVIALASEPDKESEDAGQPFVDDPLTYGTQPATPEKPATFGNGTLARVRSWYPDTPLGGGNTDAIARGVGHKFLWKPASDSNGKLAVHTPNNLHVTSITVGGETKTKPDGIGNGYRPLWRFGKAGGSYGAPVPVAMKLADGRSYTATIPNGGQRWHEALPISTPAPVTPENSMEHPAQPLPVTPVNPVTPEPTKPEVPAGQGELPAP